MGKKRRGDSLFGGGMGKSRQIGRGKACSRCRSRQTRCDGSRPCFKCMSQCVPHLCTDQTFEQASSETEKGESFADDGSLAGASEGSDSPLFFGGPDQEQTAVHLLQNLKPDSIVPHAKDCIEEWIMLGNIDVDALRRNIVAKDRASERSPLAPSSSQVRVTAPVIAGGGVQGAAQGGTQGGKPESFAGSLQLPCAAETFLASPTPSVSLSSPLSGVKRSAEQAGETGDDKAQELTSRLRLGRKAFAHESEFDAAVLLSVVQDMSRLRQST